MEKLVRFYFGQDLIWSQVSSSQHQSSSVNHHPSGCWHSERPGSNLCRSTDLSTHNSISPPPQKKVSAAVPTNTSRMSSPCQKSISTSSSGLHPVVFATLSTPPNLRHSAMSPLSKPIYSFLFAAELSIKHKRGFIQECLFVFLLIRCVVITCYQQSDQILDICYQQSLKPKSTPFVCKIPECGTWTTHDCIITVHKWQRSTKQWRMEEEVRCLFIFILKGM